MLTSYEKQLYFHEKQLFFQKKFSEKNGNVLHFCKTLNSDLLEDNWFFTSALAVNMFWLMYRKKKHGLTKIVRNILIFFSKDFRYFL